MAELVGPIQHKRGTTAQWAASIIPLRDGELGIDTTVRRMKVGDGSTLFPALPWQDVDQNTIDRLEDAAATLGDAVTVNDAAMTLVQGNPTSAFAVAQKATFVAAFANTTVGYDAAGNVTSVVDAGITTTYTYNADGTVATDTRLGVTRQYTYTGGNLTKIEKVAA